MRMGEDLGPDDSAFDAESLEEWVDGIAEAEGISREDAISHLVSAYWTLNEMSQLLEQTEEPAGRFSTGAGGDREDPDRSATGGEFLENVSNSFAEQIEALRERVDELEADLEESAASDAASAEELEELSERLTAFRDSMTSRHESLRARLETELENLETILEYIIQTLDDVDSRTGGLGGTVESLARTQDDIQRLQADHEQLVDLKQTANRRGIRTADCEYCDTSVDLALLASPYCPQCDRPFDDVLPKSGRFFGTDVLTVSGRRSDDAGSRGGTARSPRGGSGDRSTPDESSGDDFVWGGEED